MSRLFLRQTAGNTLQLDLTQAPCTVKDTICSYEERKGNKKELARTGGGLDITAWLNLKV